MNASDYYYFKGERKYIHSSNIFDFILAYLKRSSPTGIDFKLSRISDKIWYLETDQTQTEKGILIGQYKDDKSTIFIMESKNTVTERRPYDEMGLTRRFNIHNNLVEVPDCIDDYSFIEKVNAAFKALLNSQLVSENPINYLFVRLILDHLPAGGFAVRFKRKVGLKFYEGEILEQKISTGAIYFSEEDIL